MHDNLLSQGLELLVYGMGTVVVFLMLLVFATRLMSGLIQRFLPDAPEDVPVALGTAPSGAERGGLIKPEPEVLAAIVAAVHQHRQRASVSSVSDRDQRKSHV